MTTALDFDVLYRECRSQVFWAAWRRLENWHDAEDVAQDAFLKAFEQRGGYEPRDDTPAKAWVTAIAKWQALSYAHVRFRYVPAGEWADRFAEALPDRDTDSGLPCMGDPDTCAGVYAALAVLPDQQRLAVSMFCLSGCDRAEVGRCLRLPPHEVEALVYNAMRILRRRSRPTAAEPAPGRERPEWVARPGTDTPNSATLLAREVAQALRDDPALGGRLTDRQRQVVELLAGQTLSRAEAVQALGVTGFTGVESAVKAAARRIAADEVPAVRGGVVTPTSPDMARLVADPGLLAALPVRQQQAIRLRYLGGLRIEDVAARMGATVKAVKGLLWHATVAERARFTGVPYVRRDRQVGPCLPRGRRTAVAL